MAKGIPDLGKAKLMDYHREDHGEPRFVVEPDVLPANKPDGDAKIKTAPGGRRRHP